MLICFAMSSSFDKSLLASAFAQSSADLPGDFPPSIAYQDFAAPDPLLVDSPLNPHFPADGFPERFLAFLVTCGIEVPPKRLGRLCGCASIR